jgi:hypothetical protein
LRSEAGLAPAAHLSEPALIQFDLKVSRPFPLGRGQGEFYLQVFNLFNRVNGAPIDGAATSHTFGEPVGLAGPPQSVEGGFRVSF